MKNETQKIDGYWVIVTNKWNVDNYTKEQAEMHSRTLINCIDCTDCRNCIGCSSCSSCAYCTDCSDCRNCSSCHNCHNCSSCAYCTDCSDFKENPERITSPKIGSRHENTTYYFTKEHEQIVCGCFKGTLEEFEKAVEEKHGNNKHGIEYKNWIEKVKLYKRGNK